MGFIPTAHQESNTHSFCSQEELVLLSGAKFLLLDGQWQLGLDIHDGPLHHHEAVLVQQIRVEEGLWGREEAGDESVVLAPLCLSLPDSATQSSPAAGSGLAVTRGIAWGCVLQKLLGDQSPRDRSKQLHCDRD